MGGGVKMMEYHSEIQICSMMAMKGFSRCHYSPKSVKCEWNVWECIWTGLAIPREPFKGPGALLEESKGSRCSPAGLGEASPTVCSWGGSWEWPVGGGCGPWLTAAGPRHTHHAATRNEFRQWSAPAFGRGTQTSSEMKPPSDSFIWDTDGHSLSVQGKGETSCGASLKNKKARKTDYSFSLV